MEISRERPPAYVSHDPADLQLPSIPQEDFKHTRCPPAVTLPDLKTVLGGLPSKTAHPNKLFNAAAYKHASHTPRQTSVKASPRQQSSPRVDIQGRWNNEAAMASPSDSASIMSLEDQSRRSMSIVSLEDPDVRLAAEALSGLGNPDYIRSPSKTQSSHMSQHSPDANRSSVGTSQTPEPLLNLLIEAHPWVGGTINGSLSAYATTKNYSPRFVQYGANLIERNIGSPVANTVSSVGRRTGVEGGIRRYLGSRRPSDIERAEPDGQLSKRRRVMGDEDGMDIDQEGSDSAVVESGTRRESRESLPAYRGSKPPSYREEASPTSTDRLRIASRPQHNRSWSTQLMISTSGLGVALSESSLRSLTYCVTLLTKATEHVETVMSALKLVLREYDDMQESRKQDRARRAKEVEAGLIPRNEAEKDEAARKLAERMKQLCDDIWDTMKTVVNSVSTYAGGALPENARRVVKGQLMSVPQRWRLATETAARQHQTRGESSDGGEAGKTSSEQEPRGAAHRMLAFADEGLDMMAQVNGVVKVTLESAEDWLRTMGRKRQEREEEMLDADDPAETPSH